MDRARPVVVPTSEDACAENVCSAKACDGKVVLVFRGGCGFYQKGLNVMKSSGGQAAGLIVADNADGKALITLIRGTPKVDKIEKTFSIPVVAVLKKTGDEIKKALAEGAELSAMFHFPGWEDREKEWEIRKGIEANVESQANDPALGYHNLAIALSNQGTVRIKEAIEALEMSIAIKASLEALNMMAEMHKGQKKYYEAARAKCKGAVFARAEAMKKLTRDTKSTTLRAAAQQLFGGSEEANLPENEGKHVCDIEQEKDDANRQTAEEAAEQDL
jgi:hypothetical protein